MLASVLDLTEIRLLNTHILFEFRRHKQNLCHKPLLRGHVMSQKQGNGAPKDQILRFPKKALIQEITFSKNNYCSMHSTDQMSTWQQIAYSDIN